jgi:glycosyltransferase involved in cell wall biosynthesis
LKIAYFVNHYPKVSHSFIRREILALERQGFEIERIALRGWDGELPDADDQAERDRTRYVLRGGLLGLMLPTLRALLAAPARFFAAVVLAVRMARCSQRGILYHLVYVAEACRVEQWARAFGASRLHAHFGTNSADVAMLARVLGGPPYSFTVHGPDEFSRPMGLADKVHRANFVVAISSFTRSQLYLRSIHVDWNRIGVAHCGLERSFYEGQPTQPGNSTRFVCVGRICAEKGHLLLIEAAARLKAKLIPFELVLAGDGPMRGTVEELIQKHGLSGHVRITGWIGSDTVRDEILGARALVLPSFAEGLPVVLMEAMALRRPVLTTYIAGIPELVLPGECGWLFPAGSLDALAAAMEDCLAKSAVELGRMGDAAFARVVERHSIDRECAKLAALFRAPASAMASAHVR